MRRLVKSSIKDKFSGYTNIINAFDLLQNDQNNPTLGEDYSVDGYNLATIDQFLGSLDEDDFEEFVCGDADIAEELAASSPAGTEAHSFLGQGF